MTQRVFTQSSLDIGDSRQGQTKSDEEFRCVLLVFAYSFVRETVLNPPDNC